MMMGMSTKNEDEVERHLRGLCVDEVGGCAQSVGTLGKCKNNKSSLTLGKRT